MDKELFKLPKFFILLSEIGLVLLGVVIAFWSIVFISKGMLDYASGDVEDKVNSLLSTAIGVILLLKLRSYVYKARVSGLLNFVTSFFNGRFPEIIATVVSMIGVSVITGYNIHFILTDLLILPFFIGTRLSVPFGFFLRETIGIPLAPFILLLSTWILELIWMYIFSRLLVSAILMFRLRSGVD